VSHPADAPARVSPEDEYLGEHHVYEPHRVGLPKLGPYVRELWRRRSFAMELARTEMHAANTDTVLGQAWLIVNPLLLSLVYYLLVTVISPSRGGIHTLAHITGGLFVYSFITTAMQSAASAVTQSGKLILNTSFPKMLLPLADVYLSLRRFLPTLVVYFAIHLAAGRPIDLTLLWLFPVLGIAMVFATGLANLMATLQVYFRDTVSFLPYFLRIWLYLSPVLLTVEEIRAKFHGLQVINPLYSVLGAWTTVVDENTAPSFSLLAQGVAWAVVTFLVGSIVFMSRERDFAVRI
jgi:teichoic acid transport system permease protein